MLSFMKKFAWPIFVFSRGLKNYILRIKRLVIQPKLPKNKNAKVLIHLGCGPINSPEFINVDIRPAPHVHYIRDVTDLSIFPNNYADLVYACHVLEHIEEPKLKKVLCEWRRVLKAGGTLRISVPDFDKLLFVYETCNRDTESIRMPLMGYRDGYNAHCMIFNYNYLKKILCELGFIYVHEWDPSKVQHHNFEDWASKYIKRNNREFHISLNVEAVKQDFDYSKHC